MQYHYETQPIPNPISYYLHQTPVIFHQFEVLVNHFIELVAPVLCLLPNRQLRHLGGTLQILFQCLLIVSGNLSVLNWITMGPALWCFDDTYPLYKYLFRRQFILTQTNFSKPMLQQRSRKSYLRSIIHSVFFALIVYLSIDPIRNLFSSSQRMNSSFDRFNLVNTYGAFGSVGKVRHEIIISACNRSTIDQCNRDHAWQEYEFRCKAGQVDQAPCFTAPYHRRLPWQLW
jgi:lipase maturation factor 1